MNSEIIFPEGKETRPRHRMRPKNRFWLDAKKNMDWAMNGHRQNFTLANKLRHDSSYPIAYKKYSND
jgi:hypothetical protein